MNRRSIALLTALLLLISVFPAAAAPSESIQAVCSFDKTELTAGKLTASLSIAERGDSRRFVAALIYCSANGTLLSHSAKTAETAPLSGLPICTAAEELTLEIETEPASGSYARLVVMDAATLEPITVSGGILRKRELPTPTYGGMFERYYTVEGAEGSLAILQDGSRKQLGISANGTPFRLKDMGEGWVAFADGNDTKYRLYNNGGTPGRRIYGFGSDSMLWRLIPADGKYYIQSHDGGYLSVKNGGATLDSEPCPFELVPAGESPFTLLTGTEGYGLLSEAQKQRLTEICTSPGAGVFPNGTNGSCLLDTLEARFSAIIDGGGEAEKQKSAILAAMGAAPLYNAAGTDEISAVSVNNLPGGGAEITKEGPFRETLYIWDTGEKEYSRFDVTYTGSGHSQTVKFYFDETGTANVQTAIEALARFPYEYRQFLKQVNVYVPNGALSYNCDGPVLTVRVSDGTGVEAMARNFAHELGHSIDMAGGGNYQDASTHWCQSAEWQKAVENDAASVSSYAEENFYEGLAEFARLYFQSWGNRDMTQGVKSLYPNRYASFVKLLEKIGMEPLY